MASLRQIRRRLRSTQSTKQVMRAMQLVSGSKFKRAQTRLLQGRQALEFLDGLLQRVLVAEGHPGRTRGTANTSWRHPLMARHEGKPGALIIVTSDTGLAGAYNANLIQFAESELRRPFGFAQGAVLSVVEGRRDTASPTQVSYVGKRGHRYFTKRGSEAREAYLDLAGRPEIRRIDAIGQALMDRFLAGEVSSVRLLYATFVSASVSRPTIAQWLPIQLQGGKGQETRGTGTSSPAPRPPPPAPVLEYLFEPSPQRVFEDLLPRWAIATFRVALLEAFTAEHGARMIAMKNATDNAQELLESLTMQRNKIRQASITKELSEIVGTAEALK